MKKLVFSLVVALLTVALSQAQLNINDYKYVIVENQFHFQNEQNEYHLNRMVKFQFKKYGFNAIIEGEPLPDDLKSNYCLALNSEVIAKGALRTKAKIILRDCDNNVVYTSPEGATKEKNFDRAYDLAIRNAFESFSMINYKYVPNERIVSQGQAEEEIQEAAAAKEEIKELKAKIEALEEKSPDTNTAKVTAVSSSEISAIQQSSEEVKVDKVEQITKEKKVAKEAAETMVESKRVIEKPYYKAVTITDGYELVNSKTNEVKYVIYATGKEGVFILKEKSGIVYMKGETWGREYVEGGKITFKILDIRF